MLAGAKNGVRASGLASGAARVTPIRASGLPRNPIRPVAARPAAPARVTPKATHLDRGEELTRALETASKGIRDPVAKLRYIRGSLSRYQKIDRAIQSVPSMVLRGLLYRFLSLESLRHLLSQNPMGAPSTVDLATRRAVARNRRLAAAAAAGVLISAGALIFGTYRAGRAVAASPLFAASAGATTPVVAESLPPLPQGKAPAGVWLVEKGEGFEQYSNGLRIDTASAVSGDPRQYRLFRVGSGMQEKLETAPAGILFHTSESDIWPLEASFNESLRDSSKALIRYLQRNRTYHYLIDRFGRVYRVVEEDSKANHAGNSTWSRGDDIYINLNNAFFGVSFESRWEGGRVLPITVAQLTAGRNLTDYLRNRYRIPPEMCVTHGLTSINPKKHLIGHHVDWARGFPFEAFGLPNQYTRPAPSVAVFGFGYDDEFLKVMSEPWAGVREAERQLAAEAARQGQTVDALRSEGQELYDRWHKEQTRDAEARASVRTDRAPEARPEGTRKGRRG